MKIQQQLFFLLCAVIFWVASAQATETVCDLNENPPSSPLSGPIPGDVYVPPNGICTLNGATVDGDVLVVDGGELTVQGGGVFNPSHIYGSIYSDGAELFRINGLGSDGVRIEGDVVIDNTKNIICENQAIIEGSAEINGDPDNSIVGNLIFGNCHVSGYLRVKKLGDVTILGNHIIGNLYVVKNSGDILIQDNDIDDIMRVRKNSGPFAVIKANVVMENLRIRKNTFTDDVNALTIEDNVIGGNLNCVDNDPFPTTPTEANKNTVNGNAKNQCESGFKL